MSDSNARDLNMSHSNVDETNSHGERDNDQGWVESPIEILMSEHASLLAMTVDLIELATSASSADVDHGALERIAEQFRESESHYLREENVLFPYIEKHGITGPTRVMWMEHDAIRPLKKQVRDLVAAYCAAPGAQAAQELLDSAQDLQEMLQTHFQKENNILFPAAMRVIQADEWSAILQEFDQLGYPSFSAALRPPRGSLAEASSAKAAAISAEGVVELETGSLSLAQLESILSILPVELTFVDASDRVRFFSNNRERIFIRTKATLGREVHDCHPEKSQHLVDQILDEFRAGTRDTAEFWLPVGDKMIHIRFFALRDRLGAYLGCLEVTQDITDIQKLTGQKRLV